MQVTLRLLKDPVILPNAGDTGLLKDPVILPNAGDIEVVACQMQVTLRLLKDPRHSTKCR